jgi:signal transduction histidine kinase
VHGVAGGITIIEPRIGVIQHLGRDQGLRSSFAQHLVEDDSGNRWFATNDGELFVYNFGRRLYRRVKNLPSWKGDRTYFSTKDKNGALWFGSGKGGVLKVDVEANTFQTITTSQGLLSNTAYAWLEGKDGAIWIGTSRGINRIDPDRIKILGITTHEGLAHNETWTLNERNGIIYAGTTRGLGLIEMEVDSTWRVVSFGKPQGLLVTDFNTNSGLVTSKGEFWAGIEITSLLVMDEPKFDSLRPVTQISDVQILGRSIKSSDSRALEARLATIDTLWNLGTASSYPSKAQALEQNSGAIRADSLDHQYFLPINPKLQPGQNYISFSYAGMDLSDPDQVRYRYILEGIDKAWSSISAETMSETYRDLPAGNYNFKVSSRGMNGLWSSPASYPFTILPPWWKSWWASVGYILLLGFAAYRVHLFQKATTVRKERERTKDRELEQARVIEKAYNDLKATQSQLIQSEKMASLGELTAGIAHEIQNPLNFVNNFSEVNKELLQEMKAELELGKTEDAIGIAQSIMENEEKILFHGKRADSIVKGMLQHSRASSGVKEPTDINALADEYLRLAYHGLRAKDKSFNAGMKTDLDPSLGKVNVVPQDLGRVILNLITNGFYAVTEKRKSAVNGYEPTVTVITRKTGDKVQITVRDNGNGIPKNILDKIFQPFFTTKPSGQGTGLGLSMSYDIVTKIHGGKIDVETKPGEGTSFILTIPNLPA